MSKLLVVDDTATQRRGVVGAAQEAGYRADEIVCPESWEDAVTRVTYDGPFDAAVVDIDLWGRWDGGVDIIRELHRRQPDCRIVALTLTRGELGPRANRAGATAFHYIWNDPDWSSALTSRLGDFRARARAAVQPPPPEPPPS